MRDWLEDRDTPSRTHSFAPKSVHVEVHRRRFLKTKNKKTKTETLQAKVDAPCNAFGEYEGYRSVGEKIGRWILGDKTERQTESEAAGTRTNTASIRMHATRERRHAALKNGCKQLSKGRRAPTVALESPIERGMPLLNVRGRIHLISTKNVFEWALSQLAACRLEVRSADFSNTVVYSSTSKHGER